VSIWIALDIKHLLKPTQTITKNSQVESKHTATNIYVCNLPNITLARRTENFAGKIRQCENLLAKRLLRM